MLTHLLDTWTSFYSNHALLRSAIGFIHVGGLMLGGGCAITADLATIQRVRRGSTSRADVHLLDGTHAIVVTGLVALFVSGALLFAADAVAFVHSRVFWLKMALLGALMVNGVLMLAAERRVHLGDTRAWGRLHTVSVASLVLWFVTTLAGAALPNM